MRLALALFAPLLAAPAGRAADTYDLRGPGPAKGQVVVTKSTMTMKENDLELSLGGQKVMVKQTMKVVSEEEEEYLEVKGREVMKSRAKIVKEETTTAIGDDDGEAKAGGLEGETILTERARVGWKHALADGKATEEQEKELKKRNGPENEDDLYPAERVAVGHKWKVDASKMKSLTGNSFVGVTGEMSQFFAKVEVIDGEECALVETKGTLTGKLNDDEGNPAVEMTIAAKSWRSLKSGLELKGEFSGTIKIEGKTKINDEDVEMKMSGPIEGTSAAQSKK